MMLLLDIGLLIVLVRVLVRFERPLLCATVYALFHLGMAPLRAFTESSILINVFGIGALFLILYGYFWFLWKIPNDRPLWWFVMVSLPLFKVLRYLPLSALRFAP